jgi:hypothetical protein
LKERNRQQNSVSLTLFYKTSGYDGVEDFPEKLAGFVRDQLDRNVEERKLLKSNSTAGNEDGTSDNHLSNGELNGDDDAVLPSLRLINDTSMST